MNKSKGGNGHKKRGNGQDKEETQLWDPLSLLPAENLLQPSRLAACGLSFTDLRVYLLLTLNFTCPSRVVRCARLEQIVRSGKIP